MPVHLEWMEIAANLAEEFIAWVTNMAKGNIGIALAVVIVFAALSGLLLAAILKLLRAFLPLLVAAGTAAFLWRIGLLEQCWQWLAGFMR